MEALQSQHLLGNRAEFFDPPAGVAEVGEGCHGAALAVQRRGGERVFGAARAVFDEEGAAGPERRLRLLVAGLGTWRAADEGVAAVVADEDGIGIGLEAEDGGDAAIEMALWVVCRVGGETGAVMPTTGAAGARHQLK